MVRFHKRRIVFSVLALGCVGGLAGAPAVRSQSQAEMNEQAGREYKKSDQEMNVAYKKLMTTLDADQKAQLKISQNAWLKFRDAEADFLSSKAKGGTIWPTIHGSHLTQITQERTRELRTAYKLFTTESDL